MVHSSFTTYITRAIFITTLIASSAVFSAANVAAGKAKAVTCIGCHGPEGIAFAPNFPNLAGQKAFYLATAIQSYRTGERNDPTMKAMVAGLTDADVANLAAYYASLPRK